MKNILAENMIRFRTKNLVEQTKVNSRIYGDPFGTYTLQEMAGLINTYNPSADGYIEISDGNEWLANQRAKSLSQFFSENVSNILDVSYNSEAVKIEEAKVLGPGNKNQYVLGTLYAILEKPGRKLQTYKYSLKYNFYEVDGEPHIIVTKRGMGTPSLPINKITGGNALAKEYATNFMPKLPNNSKLVWKQRNRTTANEFKPASQGTLAIMIPLASGPKYSKKDGNALYFNTPEQFNAMRDFISKYEKDEDKFTGTQSFWTSTMGGGGSYVFGSSKPVSSVHLPNDVSKLPEIDTKLNIFNNPETVNIRSTHNDKNAGEGGSTIPGTRTKPETRKIGDFKFDKTMFADNMIGIQDTPELRAKLEEIKKAYNDVISKNTGFGVKSISSIVRGYASSDAATNRTDSGKPDHGWGINWPIEKWMTK
jgi:hypothetical protein